MRGVTGLRMRGHFEAQTVFDLGYVGDVGPSVKNLYNAVSSIMRSSHVRILKSQVQSHQRLSVTFLFSNFCYMRRP